MSNWDTVRLFSETKYRTVHAEGEIRSILFQNEPYLGTPTEVFAYLGVPDSTAPPIPGIVCVHGGGGQAFKQWVEMWVGRGYAAIAMDLSGRDADGNRLSNGGPEQDDAAKFSTSVEWKDLWTYHAVAAVIRANSILRGLPAVDPDRIGITGISWGGYLTCIVAGVDARLACAVPVYGCGYLQHNSAEDWMKTLAGMTPQQRRDWNNRCDPSMYLGSAALPMLFVSGTNDFAYPLDILKMSSALPEGPATLCVRVGMEHGHEAGWAPKEIQIFADQHLRGGEPLPSIGTSARHGREVRAEFTSVRPIVRGHLLYTEDRRKWQDRNWHCSPAALATRSLSAELPTDTTAYFLAIEDDRGAYVSTTHAEVPIRPVE